MFVQRSTEAAQLLNMTRIGTGPRINRQSGNKKVNTHMWTDQGTNSSCVKSSNQLICWIILVAADAFCCSSPNHTSLSAWHNLGHFVTSVPLKKLTAKPFHHLAVCPHWGCGVVSPTCLWHVGCSAASVLRAEASHAFRAPSNCLWLVGHDKVRAVFRKVPAKVGAVSSGAAP